MVGFFALDDSMQHIYLFVVIKEMKKTQPTKAPQETQNNNSKFYMQINLEIAGGKGCILCL